LLVITEGKLCVSVTILEPGDELPRRPGNEVSEGGDAAECDLRVQVYRALKGCRAWTPQSTG